ncbi:virion structural protein [Pseudomonas phage PhiPA3]|uniref:Virion structural protein n=1 Tax=Pseudomonas phage PhiPA3 TaxID=998086 RepID=F8SK49_BPPA3|nr:virion structural protein [Pseudomonas phage PhiPA3]AEH03599.1 virion structural protein [Pseudomonas phage PhiPA3]
MKLNVLTKYSPGIENHTIEDAVFDPSLNKFFTEGDPNSAEQTAETEALPIDQTPTDKLFDALQTVSTEAGFIGNVSNWFARKAGNLNMNVREGFRYLTSWNYDPMQKLNVLQMRNFVETLDYMTIETLRVSQPAGFRGELLPYTTGLQKRAQIMAEVVDKVIKPATARFGHYLSTPEERAERRHFQYGAELGHDLDALIKADAAHFSSNRVATAKFGELFSSMNDFIECERNMVDVNTILNGGTTSTVKNAVEALSQTATALVDRIAKDKDIKTSSELAKMIAEEIAEVARWVEWYSVQMTRIIETNNVLYSIEQELRAM